MRRFWVWVGVVALAGASTASCADLVLHGLFTSDMVLQRNVPIPVYGMAEPGTEVTVEFCGETARVRAGADGAWRAVLGARGEGEPQPLRVSAGGHAIVLTNVVLGDVWVCGGQSNMEWPVCKAMDADAEIAAATHPGLRLFQVERRQATSPVFDIRAGSWRGCTPETVAGFSAVGYFFGREIAASQEIPIGLISVNWGGTPAEAWTRREALLAEAGLAHYVTNFEAQLASYPARLAAYEATREAEDARYAAEWTAWRRQVEEQDAGMRDHWAAPALDDADWETVKLPAIWTPAKTAAHTVVWVRKTFEVPAGWDGDGVILHLGAIDDVDVTYLDGVEIGRTDQDVREHWSAPRRYRVPTGALTAGVHVIAVRVIDFGARGGFAGKPNELKLERGPADFPVILPLAGRWRRNIGLVTDLATHPRALARPADPSATTHAPSMLYNGMIAGLTGFPVQGVIWYQGEANANRAYEYRTLFPAMIRDWRAQWELPDMAFLWVQLANFRAPCDQPCESEWAELREAQTMALRLPRTGMACSIDLGEADNIHPANKQEVGRRLARVARRRIYGERLVESGPVYAGHAIESGRIRIRFTVTDGGLVSRGPKGRLFGFAVAGEDRVFRWASGRIEGDSVVVWNDEVPAPVAVRHAWADNPMVSLYNGQGLPAAPFRTDDWPGITLRKEE